MDNIFTKTCERRLVRALTQRLFYLETLSVNKYLVQGSTGDKTYEVTIDTIPSCTCPDNKYSRYRCKHIYFILKRYLHVPDNLIHEPVYSQELLDAWHFDDSDIPPLQNTFNNTEQGIRNTLPIIISSSSSDDDDLIIVEEKKVKRKPITGECPICLEILKPKGEALIYCEKVCGNNVHLICMQRYAKFKGEWRCPLCRDVWNKM